MPSMGSHLYRARLVADRLGLPEIEADRGAFYLGSTAPDIRVITRMDREVTHFFTLADLAPQDSVERMFRAHPELSSPRALEASVVAFVAGYLTHLVLDETFINEIYRTHFGALSDRDDDPRSNVLDRALQYEMDRRDREHVDAMAAIRADIARSDGVSGIPFIEDEHLREWVTVSEDIAAQAPDYSRFRRMMTRHLSLAGYDAATIDAACEQPLDLVREAFDIVSEDHVERFWEDVDEVMTERVRGYLR
ncbi:MAG: hypothetical protein DWG82_00425 [Chloroflexi bacterium]|nr:hypothetical protein [Chloroflexota bacterium]